MSSTLENVRVIIYGDEYSIKSDVNTETAKKVADYVNLKILEVQKNVSSRDKVKVAVLSAMNITEELLGYKEKCREYLNKCEEIQKKAVEIGLRIDKNTEKL
jgi:cell division protein ZapA (FtsZ GTPase activity inhibitor)